MSTSTSTSTAPFTARRSSGVRHAPEADIESIRDLLQGYGSARSILKELIQNAEDAKATRMDLLYVKGDPTSPIALLKGPGLLVANDGVFTEDNRDAITQINLGTKGTDERAIGRFGKGLKSIFAWCEAFFIIARTDSTLGWQGQYITDLFNPWHGWRRGEWEDEFKIHGDIVVEKTEHHLNTIYPAGKSWLALWFPLRHKAQGTGAEVADEWISSSLPGNDPEFYETFCSELRSLAPSLVSLRSLQRVVFLDCTANPSNSITLEFPSQSQRIPPPGATPGLVSYVNGTMLLHNSAESDMEYQYCGLAGNLRDEEVAHLQEADDWRKVVQRTQANNSASHRAKGKPHFAALVASSSIRHDEKLGSLDLRWCVFFPVGKRPPGRLPVALSNIRCHITINLHGFFFLDSDRLRIDGLEEGFSLNSTTTTQKICLEWNRIVATQGTLARLPEAIAAFAEQQSFNNLECRELADAVRQTWTWKEFQEAICHTYTWRPRWQTGVETWSCIGKVESVLVIPSVGDHREILALVSALGPISEEFTLIAGTDGPSLPGLHCDTADGWPEELVLRLLESVQLASTGGQATANWLNRFLNDLHRHSALTPAIAVRAGVLPLLPARDPATNTSVRLSAREWGELIDSGRLFTSDPESIRWITMLRSLFPDWSCYVAHAELPNWSSGPPPPVCNATSAAEIILGQISLGDFVHRSRLVNAFTSSIHRDSKVRMAMRYLLHGEASDRNDQTKTLFLPSTQEREQIWPRLIGQLLDNEGGVDSWRLLHEQWAPILSTQVQQELNVATVDAAGAWIELRKGETELSSLAFPSDYWSSNDVCSLLQGLFQAAQSKGDDAVPALRRLRLHTLRGHPDDRVAIGDSEGKLRNGFVLDAPNFESDLTLELRAVWERFLSETKIVELISTDTLASKVQQDIFREEVDGLDRLIQLDWNFVVRRSLFLEFPREWAPLIMEALSRQGSQSISGVGPRFRATKWLPMALGGEIAPDDVVYIEGLEEEIHRLLDPAKDGWAAIQALPEWVCKHAGFSTLRNMLPSKERALEIVGLWLEDKSAWHLGLSKEFQISELKPLLAQLRDFEDLPVAALMVKLQGVGLGEDRDRNDSLLTKHILPKILQPFDYRQNGPARIEAILQRLQRGQSRAAFDAYLTQACQDRVVATILPEIRLVNQLGKWVPSRELIWPSLNLNPAVQLCSEQSGILQSLHERSEAGERQTVGGQQGAAMIVANQLAEAPDFEAEAKKLSEYLKPFRAGNVGENLPAALVAVLGGPANQSLLQELLDAGLRRRPADFLAQLLGEKTDDLAPSVRAEQFLIEIVAGESCTVANIIGEEIVVEFTKEITSLLVGDPSVLWRRHYYQNRPDTACHLVRLRWIETPDDLSDRVAVFASTIETILLKVHCNSVSGRCPSNIKEVLQRIADAGQADLRRSQSYLLDMAEARLKELGVRKLPDFNLVLQRFAEARDRRVDAEELSQQAPAIARQREEDAKRLVETAKQELRRLLESPVELGAQLSLVDAVRRKMDEFQYDLRSVAFELFQNADDAVAELEEMQNGASDPGLRRFVLQLDSERRLLEFFHWGRPINSYEYPNFQQGLTLGYDQDLQKMLTLNFSDKGVQPENRPSIVTGRFGLGFKSVFFISDRPEVVSGRLAFEIRGGFFPVPLFSETAREIGERAAALNESRLAPTAIRLKWEISHSSQIADAIDDFTAVAPLLTVFSRRIRSLAISKDAETQTWTITEKSITASGRTAHAQVGNAAFLCFRCSLRSDQRPATVLFQVGSDGVSQLPDHLTGLWITTPTAERSDLKFALNAPFKPDAGRQRLALNNPDNRAIATDVASKWKEALIELFDETRDHWDRFATIVGLHSNSDCETWWRQLWKEMTRNKVPVVHLEPIGDGNGGQILSWIAWGKSIGAMRGLIEQRPAIPSELPDHYARLVKQGDVRFSVVGLLANTQNGCFAHIAVWRSTQTEFPSGQTVRSDIADFLKRAELTFEVEKVTLERVLKAAVGSQNRVNHPTGDLIGNLLIACDAALRPNTFDAPEIQQLFLWMKEIRLLANDCAYHPADELVCGRALSDVISADEARRAAFAPDGSVLSAEYSDAALRVFIKARPSLTARASTLATWTREASQVKLPAVFNYLVHGDLGQELADQLKRPWLEAKTETAAWRGLSLEDRHEVNRKFSRWNSSIVSAIALQPIVVPEITRLMDDDEAFRLVSAWWKEEEARWVKIYEEKTYPLGFPGTLPWPGEDEWDVATNPSAQARWLILFIHAALVPLGLNRISRYQSFSQFLVSKGWLNLFANVSIDPRALLYALDDYLDATIEGTQYHFEMRQFVAFYAVAKNLEPLLLSLREAEQSLASGAFNSAFDPRTNPALTGTGIDSPSVADMLGIGSCHLLRELYRLKRLSNPLGRRFAFTPIRKVRLLCTLLFGVPEGILSKHSSELIFDALQVLGERLGLDSTFNNCFDLPLQILAENENLRTRVLKRKFDVELLDETLDHPVPDEVDS